jgi:1-acyl-sn-glycerol-3-phosphate acyltransferase
MENQAQTAPFTSASPVRFFKTIWGAIATLICVLITAILAVPAAICARFGKLRALTLFSTIWARSLINVCGVKVEIQGLENLQGVGNYVLVCNHQSFFDIFAVAAYMPGPIRFVGKKELLKIPLVGYALKNGGHVIIDREAGGKEIRKAVDIVRKGFNLCVFAEGHRYSDNRVHPFEDGAAWLAALTKLPAVPMAISGSGAFFPRLAKVVVPGGKMRMTIGRAVPTKDLKSADRAELTRQLEEAVRAMFVEEVI